jgi:hypothetical protein
MKFGKHYWRSIVQMKVWAVDKISEIRKEKKRKWYIDSTVDSQNGIQVPSLWARVRVSTLNMLFLFYVSTITPFLRFMGNRSYRFQFGNIWW